MQLLSFLSHFFQEMLIFILLTSKFVMLILVTFFITAECFSLAHLRKLYFEIKDEVFGKTRLGLACDTDAMERILKREFGDQKMTQVPNGTK